jgi:hypothetical protein
MDWLRRQAKFLFVLQDMDETCGPFTFLPADVSARVSRALGSLRVQERVDDETIYRHAKPSDAIRVLGPAGTGAVVDSSRCFHFGARARGGERLMLMFNFMGSIDAPNGGTKLCRTAGFKEHFGDDPVRELIIPNFE